MPARVPAPPPPQRARPPPCARAAGAALPQADGGCGARSLPTHGLRKAPPRPSSSRLLRRVVALTWSYPGCSAAESRCPTAVRASPTVARLGPHPSAARTAPPEVTSAAGARHRRSRLLLSRRRHAPGLGEASRDSARGPQPSASRRSRLAPPMPRHRPHAPGSVALVRLGVAVPLRALHDRVPPTSQRFRERGERLLWTDQSTSSSGRSKTNGFPVA